ncbi:MAG: hypothetical protein QM817_30215 [Archangium sp.]
MDTSPTTDSLRRTSLEASPLDSAVVIALVQQRLAAVTREAIRDALGDVTVPFAVKDFLGTLATIVVNSGDAETRRQSVMLSFLRVTLTSWLAAFYEGKADKDCKGEFLLDSAYSAFATTPVFSKLGFSTDVPDRSTECSTVSVLMKDAVSAWSVLEEEAIDRAMSLNQALNTCVGTNSTPSTNKDLAKLRTIVDEVTRGRAPATCQRERELLTATLRTDLKAILSTSGDVDLKDLKTELQKISPTQLLLAKIVFAIAQGKPVDRGQIIQLASALSNALSKWVAEVFPKEPTGTTSGVYTSVAIVEQVLRAFFDSLPGALKESSTSKIGIDLDATALLSQMVSRVVDAKRPGFYVRATVGTGLMLPVKLDDDGSKGMADTLASIHEELGVGWRFAVSKQLLVGPHLATSGLLYKLQINGTARDSWAFLAGVSVNVYRLIDLSFNFGRFFSTIPLGAEGHHAPFNAFLFSLQIPLADYLTELANQHEVQKGEGK